MKLSLEEYKHLADDRAALLAEIGRLNSSPNPATVGELANKIVGMFELAGLDWEQKQRVRQAIVSFVPEAPKK